MTPPIQDLFAMLERAQPPGTCDRYILALQALVADREQLKAENTTLNDALQVASMALERAAEAYAGAPLEDPDLPPKKIAGRCLSQFLASQQPRTAEELRSALAIMIALCANMGQQSETAIKAFHNIKNRMEGGKT